MELLRHLATNHQMAWTVIQVVGGTGIAIIVIDIIRRATERV